MFSWDGYKENILRRGESKYEREGLECKEKLDREFKAWREQEDKGMHALHNRYKSRHQCCVFYHDY